MKLSRERRFAGARFLTGAIALSFVCIASAASAETVRIVAIGASNTSGYAVGQGNAYPAILERLLKAKGYDVSASSW